MIFYKKLPYIYSICITKGCRYVYFHEKSFSHLNPGEDFLGEIIKKKLDKNLSFSPPIHQNSFQL